MSDKSVFYKVLEGDCLRLFSQGSIKNVHLTFVDPPYRQGKDYRFFDDNQPVEKYWSWLKEILLKIYDVTVDGGAIYFMQREKNTEEVLRALKETGWTFQNLIVWKKKTSAVPCVFRFSKQYQIIAFSSKGDKPRVFNKLRIDLPPLPEHKYPRKNGVYLTDVWDDIRELTSGYFAGDEAIRDKRGKRVHTQQSPVALLLRIILSSTLPGDTVLDPLAGTGTTLVVAKQLERNSIGIEIDPDYVKLIKKRLEFLRPSDNILRYYDYYRFTPNLREIWRLEGAVAEQTVLDTPVVLPQKEVVMPLEIRAKEHPKYRKDWKARLEWVDARTRALVSQLIERIENELPEVFHIPKHRWHYFYKGKSQKLESLFAVLTITKRKVHVRIGVDPSKFIDRNNVTKPYKRWFFKTREQERDFLISKPEQLDYALELLQQVYSFAT